jgi:hypothetical protein
MNMFGYCSAAATNCKTKTEILWHYNHQRHENPKLSAGLTGKFVSNSTDTPKNWRRWVKRQVTRCVAATGARIALDEIDAVVAALNQDYYKFK